MAAVANDVLGLSKLTDKFHLNNMIATI